MKMLIALEIDAENDADAYGVVDDILSEGVIQDAIHARGLTLRLVVTSAVSRPDVVHVGFIIEQATGRTMFSKAFTTQDAARAYADRVSAERSRRTNVHGEPLTFVGRVESYEVCE